MVDRCVHQALTAVIHCRIARETVPTTGPRTACRTRGDTCRRTDCGQASGRVEPYPVL